MGEKAFNMILLIESLFDVDRIKYNGIKIWPIIRRQLFNQLAYPENIPKVNKSFILLNLKSLIFGLKNIFKLRKFDYLTFSSSDRRKNINNKWEDRIFEGIHQSYNNCLNIESPIGDGHKKNSSNNYNFSESIFYLISFFLIKLNFNLKVDGVDIINKIEDYCGLKINYLFLVKRFISQKKIADFFFNDNIKFVFIANSPPYAGYIYSFKQRNIKVVEFQHGIIPKTHPTYIYKNNIGNDYTPNYMMVNGLNDYNLLSRRNFFIKKSNIKIIGNYFLSYYKRIKVKSKGYFLIISTHPFDDFIVNYTNKASKLFPNRIFVIMIRGNIETFRKKYFLEKNVLIKSANVYDFILLSDYIISITSTVALEALYLNKKVILLDFKGYARDVFGDYLVDDSQVKYVNENPNSLLNLNEFFKEDKLNNINNFFNEYSQLKVSKLLNNLV